MDRACKKWAVLAWGIGLGCKGWAVLACGLALVPIDVPRFCPHCHHPGLSEGIHMDFCIPENHCQATAGPTLGFEKGTKGK